MKLSWRARIVGVASILASAVMVIVSAPASAASDFWTRLPLYGSSNNLYITKNGGSIWAVGWSAEAGQAWHFVQVVKPGYYNIYRLYAGDGHGCLAQTSSENFGPLTALSCSSGYAVMWQVQWRTDTAFKLANVASGKCLTYDPSFGGDVYIYTCDPPDNPFNYQQALRFSA